MNEKRLIDADALVDSIEKRYCKPCEEELKDYNHIRCRACWVDDMVGEIEDAQPTVDAVEVVHGRWVKDGEVVVCSECGEEHAWEEYRATYCEDCGAKMDGGNEDEL